MSDHRFDPLDRLAETFPDPGFTIERLEKRRAHVRRRRVVVGGATATFGLACVAALLAATIGFGGSNDPNRAVSSPVDSVAATAPPAADRTPESTLGVTAQVEPGPDGLVTEEVEPGVERIIRDDAGHDLDERHPTYRYDMDGVAVTPDGTVVLWNSLRSTDTDNYANPGGQLVWALGQPGTTRLPAIDCFTEGTGVTCVDESEVETTYLADTPINTVAVAPDGTVWAAGGHDGENGGLYHIALDSAQDEPGPDNLVTEEMEPGVERIIRDDAGHDLDDRHPTYRYDMDRVAVTPDGTVVLWTSYRESDSEANPPGGLVWAIGQPGTTRIPAAFDCNTEGLGVSCVDESEEATFYLAGTPINDISVAQDGTVWAVGGHDGENGGLYRITRDMATDAAPTTT